MASGNKCKVVTLQCSTFMCARIRMYRHVLPQIPSRTFCGERERDFYLFLYSLHESGRWISRGRWSWSESRIAAGGRGRCAWYLLRAAHLFHCPRSITMASSRLWTRVWAMMTTSSSRPATARSLFDDGHAHGRPSTHTYIRTPTYGRRRHVPQDVRTYVSRLQARDYHHHPSLRVSSPRGLRIHTCI